MVRDHIVFLDIDGVLVHANWPYQTKKGRNQVGHFDPSCVAALNYLCTQLNAKIVVNSAWAINKSEMWLADLLKKVGATAEVIDKAVNPYLNDYALEICAWLDRHPTENYVAINDVNLTHKIPKDKFIYVEYGWDKGGLRKKHVNRFLESIGHKFKNS